MFLESTYYTPFLLSVSLIDSINPFPLICLLTKILLYNSLHSHVEGGEYIAGEPRPHMKYMRAIRSYIPDSVRFITPSVP